MNAAQASSSERKLTCARFEKNLPTASKKEEKESPSEASGGISVLASHAQWDHERAGECRHHRGAREAQARIRVVERQPHERRGGVAGELERRHDRRPAR